MKFENDVEFKEYVTSLVKKYKGKRIHRFVYQHETFWLKQPDRLKGIWKILKPNSCEALQNEILQLQTLAAQHAPVPELVLFGEDFFVLQDAGRSVNLYVEDDSISETIKRNILNDCAKALAELHQNGFTHGRPALRDMVWQNGKVTFIDFEEHQDSGNKMQWKKIRDCLIFIHDLFRSPFLSEQQQCQALYSFRQYCDINIWQQLLVLLTKYRWIYYMLLPFKPIAKKDLIAFYQMYEHILPQLQNH